MFGDGQRKIDVTFLSLRVMLIPYGKGTRLHRSFYWT